MRDDTTPIINRIISAGPSKPQATQQLWSRVHKLSEKIDIVTNIYGKLSFEINELSLALIRHQAQKERKAFVIFWFTVAVSTLLSSITAATVIYLR